MSKKWTATFGGTKEENEAQEECNQAEDEEQAECEANLDQCPILPGGILKALFIITPIVIILNVHFAFVLYVHYVNSALPESQGGCDDPDCPDYQEQIDDWMSIRLCIQPSEIIRILFKKWVYLANGDYWSEW